MDRDFFIKWVQNRVAEVAIGASTLRNQGSSDMVKTARDYLKEISLREFVVSDEKKFRHLLNKHTNQLRREFRVKARKNWGAARKSLNIFLRDALYNRYLYSHYHLSKIEQWLEVPLDSSVRKRIEDVEQGEPTGVRLLEWSSIKDLKMPASESYQNAAKVIAKRKKVARVHLDLYYFRKSAMRRGETEA